MHKTNIISFEKIGYLMVDMPTELVFMLRASNIIGIHNATLDGTTRERLNIYTSRALQAIVNGLMK